MTHNKQRLQKRASSRRHYEKRKTAGECAYSGCSWKPDPKRVYCRKHLNRMARINRARNLKRKAESLCIRCGLPQFWGVYCIMCRQLSRKSKSALPTGAKRALRLYRHAEQRRELEELQVRARFAIRKLLAEKTVTGDYARALRLYAGLDNGSWRSYPQVARVMHISSERVRQLLYPSKIVLAEMLEDVPWRAVISRPPRTSQERSWRHPVAIPRLANHVSNR